MVREESRREGKDELCAQESVRSASPREALTLVSNHWRVKDDVRNGSVADISERIRDVHFTPESGHAERQHRRPLSAKSGPRLLQSRCLYE